MKQEKVLLVQPRLLHYRVPVYNRLAESVELHVASDASDALRSQFKFRFTKLRTVRFAGFAWQPGLLGIVFKQRYDSAWVFGDVNFVSSSFLILWCWATGCSVYIHGQGVFKKSRLALARLAMLKAWVSLSRRYVSYSQICTQSMLDAGFRADKIICIENRFENGETMPAPPAPNAKRNIAFIGRLRPGCEIEMLLDALTQINSERIVPVELHVIGDGPSLDQLRTATSDRNWVTWHGEITSQQQIEAIVSDCTIGAYPGRAGLSAIEYMRYGLACVFADDMSYHMGPEPSHVKNGYNGWTFKAESIDDLRDTLAVALNSDRLQESRVNAHSTFQEIHRMSYGDEMAKLLIG